MQELKIDTKNTFLGRVKPGQGETILAVDDDKDFLPAMVSLLSLTGYHIITANNGHKAIEAYRQNRPDAVLMDRNMPQMSGAEAAQHILEFDPKAKVVLLSGYDANGYNGIETNLQQKISAYLTKPVQLRELSSVLSKVLTGKK